MLDDATVSDEIRIVMCPNMPCAECGPHSVASRWTLCPRCKRILAKCSAHGANMERVRADHRC
jgi:hypothetical protein